MKLVKALLSILVVLFFTSTTIQSKYSGKTGYYLTYNDYKNNKLIEMDEIPTWNPLVNNYSIVFKKDKKKEKIKCADMWGFLFKGVLFRIDKDKNHPARVFSDGKIVYYENGSAHLQMVDRENDNAEFSIGYMAYFSNDLSSPMVPLPSGISDAKKKYEAFFTKNKQHKPLYDCLENWKNINTVRDCVKNYNEEKN